MQKPWEIHFRKWRHTAQTAGVVLLSLAVLAGCGAPEQGAENAADQEPQIKPVKVANVTKVQIADPDEVVADVLPSLQIDVPLKVDGEVLEVLKERGEYVQEGEVILKIDNEDAVITKQKAEVGLVGLEAQIIKAREDLANNIKRLEQSVQDSEQNYNKMRNDYDYGLVTEHQLEQAAEELDNLRRELDTLKRTNSLAALEQQYNTTALQLQEADKLLGHHDVKAPISGILTELPVEEKMSLTRGTVVAQVQQLDPVKIKADLTEAARQMVDGKTELELYVPGTSQTFKGTVTYMADVISSQTKAYALELEVPNPESALKPGMRVQILLNTPEDQEVVAVPTSSIVREGSDTYVFVLKGDTVEKRKVELGRLKETNQEIISGLNVGEQLVISGQHQLKDQEKVQVTADEPQPAQN